MLQLNSLSLLALGVMCYYTSMRKDFRFLHRYVHVSELSNRGVRHGLCTARIILILDHAGSLVLANLTPCLPCVLSWFVSFWVLRSHLSCIFSFILLLISKLPKCHPGTKQLSPSFLCRLHLFFLLYHWILPPVPWCFFFSQEALK